MFYAVFHHSGTEHLFEMGVWITVVPVFLLLALAKLKLGGIAGGENEEWASRRTRLVIWSIVALLVIVAVLLIVWVLRLEGAESTLR